MLMLPSSAHVCIFVYYNSIITNNTINTDWLGYVLRDGSIDNHNLNISGGTENIRYYASASINYLPFWSNESKGICYFDTVGIS